MLTFPQTGPFPALLHGAAKVPMCDLHVEHFGDVAIAFYAPAGGVIIPLSELRVTPPEPTPRIIHARSQDPAKGMGGYCT